MKQLRKWNDDQREYTKFALKYPALMKKTYNLIKFEAVNAEIVDESYDLKVDVNLRYARNAILDYRKNPFINAVAKRLVNSVKSESSILHFDIYLKEKLMTR